jgi:predicted ester cyclase
MTATELVAFCQRWKEVMQRQDIDAAAEFYSQDAEIQSPLAGSVIGREGFLKASEAFSGAFADATIVFEPPIVGDDRAAVVGEINAHHVGPLMGLAPTGRSVHVTIAFALDIRDGLIVRDRRIYDFTGMLVQAGVLKAKPA